MFNADRAYLVLVDKRKRDLYKYLRDKFKDEDYI